MKINFRITNKDVFETLRPVCAHMPHLDSQYITFQEQWRVQHMTWRKLLLQQNVLQQKNLMKIRWKSVCPVY